MDATIKILAGWGVIISFKYALYAQVNQGAITTIYNLSGIYVAMISWFVFNEKLNRFHLIGMFLLIGCAVTIVLSRSSGGEGKVEVYDSEVDKMNPLIPVLMAAGISLVYACRSIYVKLFVKNLNFNSFDFMTYSYLLSGIIFVPHVISSMQEYEFILEVVVLGIISGILNALSSFFLYYATSTGVTGPAYSLRSIEPIIQAVFGSLLFEIYLNGTQIFAICLGILGSLTLTLGPMIFKTKDKKKA
mmetsp:Transcript_22575/g.22406  ORF Transcript_22575/g.22406 Transcript_22575/m.22406 type:complete len:246 (+) Transcript_22575:382-1119(+)